MKRPALFLVLVLAIALEAVAQKHPYRRFTVRDGLPQSQVTCMTQHPDGHLWIGTKDGIARFDGKAFKVYRSESIRGELRGLHLLTDSTFALRHTGGRIKRFNSRTGVFTEIASDFVESGLYPSPLKRDSQGLYRMLGRDPEKRTLHSMWQLQDTSCIKIDRHDGFLRSLPEDRWWGWSLCQFSGTHWFVSQFGDLVSYRNGEAEWLAESRSKEHIPWRWFHSSTDTLYRFDFESSVLYRMFQTQIPVDTLPEFPFKEPWRTSLAMDSKGTIYALADRSELYALFPGHEEWAFIDDFNYATLFIDHDDNLYVADEGAFYQYSNFAFAHYTPEKDGIPRYIWTVLDDNDGNTWMGSYGHGLWKWSGGQLKDLTGSYINDLGWASLTSTYMGGTKDHQGTLMFCGHAQLLAFKHGREKPLRIEREPASALMIWQDDRTKLIYAGTTEGVDVIDTNYRLVEKLRDSVHLPLTIVSIERDAKDNLWFGAFRNLTKYDGSTFTSGFKDECGKPISAICMESDSSGTMWVGGIDGLRYLKNGRFFPVEDGPFTGTVGSLCAINHEQLLVALMDGIAIISMKDFFSGKRHFYRYFGHSEGFTGIEPGQNGFHRRADGTVWIPTTDQLTLIHPDRLPVTTKPIDLFVDGLTVNWNDSVYDLSTDAATGKLELKDKIPYRAERIRIWFHAVNYQAPEEVVYSFRLDDGHWSTPQEERHIDFTELDHGPHSLTIRAWHGNQPKPENMSTAQVRFCVKTPFYHTWWFLTGSIALSIFSVSCITVLIGRRRRRNETMQHQLAMELNDLQYKALKTQVEPHFAANLLNSVNAAILREDRQKASRILGNFSRMIRDILRQNDRRVHSLEEELDLVERYVELEKYILGDKLRYSIDIAAQVMLDRPVPVMLIHTFVENAIKHALRVNPDGGEVSVRIERNEWGTGISISDTGRGNEPSAKHHQSSRKGISLIDNIVRIYNRYNEHKMSVEVNDHTDGRTVAIFIPHDYRFET